MEASKPFIDAVRNADIRTTARLMREIEDRTPLARKTVVALLPYTGNASVIGITGPPGAGKSTLVDRLIVALRSREMTVGVLAVDPTSPVSGGAILGDRIRMQQHATDAGVFIRSVASRGHVGGLSRSVYDMVTVLDAMGKEIILVETVGVGQDAVEIVEVADTTVLVVNPGMGDGIQAIKGGILETVTIVVVNKADREGADQAVGDLEALFSIRELPRDGWQPLVLKTDAARNQGVQALADAIFRHREYIKKHPDIKARLRDVKTAFLNAFQQELVGAALARMEQDGRLEALFSALENKTIDPVSAAEQAVATLFEGRKT